MGYTHYWYRELEIDKQKYSAIVRDFKTLIKPFESFGIKLGDGCGENSPLLTDDVIAFNGLHKCAHPQNAEISIPWPAKNAGGVSSYKESETGESIAGTWFAGSTLSKRTCNGSCDYESVNFDRIIECKSYIDKRADGLEFDCCKTAYRPYDLAVTAFLIIAKHHLKDKIKIYSDGEATDWFDGALLCKTNLGYGLDFKIDTGD